jgi:hypothetical protein
MRSRENRQGYIVGFENVVFEETTLCDAGRLRRDI